jgi:hypothetical protein
MTEANGNLRSKRALSIGINVSALDKLPKAGVFVARFLKSVDGDHGPFDVNIAISVEPTEDARIGSIEFPRAGEETPRIIVITKGDGDDFDYEVTEGSE